MGLIKGDTRSLDYISYIPIDPNFHVIFHVLFHLILHYASSLYYIVGIRV